MATANCELWTGNGVEQPANSYADFLDVPQLQQQLRLQLGNSGWPLRKSLRKPNNSGNKMLNRSREGEGQGEGAGETNCHRCRWCRRARQISTISVINLPFQSLPVIERERDSYPLLAWPAARHHHHLLSVCSSVCWWFLINWPAAKPNRPPHMDTATDQTGCKVSIAPVFCSISSRCAFCFEFSFMLVTPPPHSPHIHSS